MRLRVLLFLLVPIGLAVSRPGEQAQGAPTGFIGVLPQSIDWHPDPTVRGLQVAVLVGAPDKSGPLVLRVKLPANVKIMPHTHPNARTYTVLSGEWKLGFGDHFDSSRLLSFSSGSLYWLPARVPHFQATGSAETVVQIECVGPTATDFLGSDNKRQ
jgi:uncharacterized RmlC-like cupin family protein